MIQEEYLDGFQDKLMSHLASEHANALMFK